MSWFPCLITEWSNCAFSDHSGGGGGGVTPGSNIYKELGYETQRAYCCVTDFQGVFGIHIEKKLSVYSIGIILLIVYTEKNLQGCLDFNYQK